LNPIYLDVVSGASAGALTGAMMTHFIGSNFYATLLAGDLDARLEHWVRRNFEAWCGDSLSMASLLSEEKDEKRTSILSAKPIEAIASHMLTPADPALPGMQKRLLFTCTLTGVTAIEYDLSMPKAKPRDLKFRVGSKRTEVMRGRTRRDWVTFSIREVGGVYPGSNLSFSKDGWLMEELASDPGLCIDANDRDLLWDRLKWFSMASGSFPLAWNPVRMERSTRFYPDTKYGSRGFRKFDYSDGGIINNMPLDRACKVIRDFSRSAQADLDGLFDRRGYLLIGTDLKKSEVRENPKVVSDTPSGDAPKRDSKFNQGPLGAAIFESMREQSFFDDLRDAKRINRQLELREKMIWPMLARYANQLIPLQASAELDIALQELHKVLRKKMPFTPTKAVQEASSHLIKQYSARSSVVLVAKKHNLQGPSNDLFIANVVLHDLIHDNAEKHNLEIIQVHATQELHSKLLGNFGGFLDSEYRKRDFLIGIESARARLEAWTETDAATMGWAIPETVLKKLGLTDLKPIDFPSEYSKVPEAKRKDFQALATQALFRKLPFLGTFKSALKVGAFGLIVILVALASIAFRVPLAAIATMIVLGALSGIMLWIVKAYLNDPIGILLQNLRAKPKDSASHSNNTTG
jgi:hypothetical protein